MAKTLTKTSSPAIEQLQRLTTAFDIFNTELFDGALPPVMLQLANKPGSLGYFQPNKWKNSEGVLLDVISLDSKSAATRPLPELLSTLVHEMAHSYVFHCCNDRKATGGHGVEWRRKMLDIGLPPIQVGRTWRSATHSIDPDGAYMQAFERHRQQLQELPWQECIGYANRGRGVDRVKFQCPHCGFNAWAKAAGAMLCGFCSTRTALVEMLPEYRAEGGGGKGGSTRATAKREHYPEPSGTPALPVWTDELGRELRLHTGVDRPPQTMEEALVVMFFGVQRRDPQLFEAWIDSITAAERRGSAELRKSIYKHRAKQLHPDVEGGSEVAFKALQVAYRMLDWDKVTADETRTAAQNPT